jgi:hypothetical protein
MDIGQLLTDSMRRTSNLLADAPATAPAAPASASPSSYLDLYGLSKPPFGESYGYVLFGSHRRVFETLADHVVNGKGLAVVYGEEGAGKTELLRAIDAVATEAGCRTLSLAQLAPALLGGEHRALLIDDADLLPRDCAQALRDWAAEPASFAVIVTSVNDLGTAAAHAGCVLRMPRLSASEMRDHIEKSLWIAGGTTRRLLAPDALKLIVMRSGGLFGTLNRLMEAAFTAGFVRGDPLLTARTIEAASGPVRVRPEPAEKPNRLIPILALLLLLIGAGAFLYRGLIAPAHEAPAPAAALSHGQ